MNRSLPALSLKALAAACLLSTLVASPDAWALKLGLAVMDARSAGMAPADVRAVEDAVRAGLEEKVKGTPFQVVAASELRALQAQMPQCAVGTCDLQVARRQGARVLVSLEVALVGAERSVSLRMAEAEQGALLSKASARGATQQALLAAVPDAVKVLWEALKAAHNAAVAAVRAGAPTYRLQPADDGTAATVSAAPPLGSRRMIEDGEPVKLEAVLKPVRPDLNTCYEAVLVNKPRAKGRIKVSLDVEPDGAVSRVDIVEDEILDKRMQACVTARMKKVTFGAMDRPWRVAFPLVFVPAQKP